MSQTNAKHIDRRAIIKGATIATAAGIVSASALRSTIADEQGPIPELVERLLPLNQRYRETMAQHQKQQESARERGHPIFPVHYVGGGTAVIVSDGDVSGIEKYFAERIAAATSDNQREHFAWRRDVHIAKGRAYWEQWRQEHEEFGLFASEKVWGDAEEALDEVEKQLDVLEPKTLADGIALLRWVLALSWDYEHPERDEQDFNVDKLAGVVDFLRQHVEPEAGQT